MLPLSALSQLTEGDVAFTGFNGDGDDDFAIVALTDVPANSTIYFTDSEWNGTAFDSGEDDITWTTGGTVISAGTVVTFSDINSSSESVSAGSITAGNMSLGVSNEAIFAYLGSGERSPSTFLAAVSSSKDQYNGTDGTLSGTNLTQGKEAILLADNIDVAQYIGDRSGNTKKGYLNLLNDVGTETATDDNWKQVGGTGDQSGQILPFDTQNFTIINPPTLHFTASADAVAEDGVSIDLTVELAESTNNAVSVEVAFLSGSSTANGSDINYSPNPQTVNFTASDNSGATRTVTVNLTDDSNFEGDEKAVFQLQNPSTGNVVPPETLTLTIMDDDTPAVVINEILADPAAGPAPSGDANGDGTRDSGDDEFVEIVNNTTSDIDISGWQLSDDGTASSITHTFPSGTALPANGAAVVFGSGDPQGGFGGAIVQTTSSLSLTNGGGHVTLLDDQDNIIQDITYGSDYSGSEDRDAGDNQSITRYPDITGGFIRHSMANSSGSGGPAFSPGTEVDGTAFGGGYAVAFRGTEGYRFVSTPAQSTTFDDLFANLWTQGINGADANNASDAANIYRWDETGGGNFGAVSSMGDQLTPGKGYIIYAYADDDFRAPGTQGGFPKTISTSNQENGSVSVNVTASDDDGSGSIDGKREGYNLLGNPYGTDISVDAVITAVENAVPSATVNQNVYIWNNATSSYEVLDRNGDTIAPFQAFFVRITTAGASGTVSFTRSDLAANQGTQFYKTSAEEAKHFTLRLGRGDTFNRYEVEFNKHGNIGEDKYDAYKLFSLDADAIQLYSTVGNGVKLAKNILPELNDLDSDLHIPLGYDVPESGEYTLSWGDLKEVPQDLDLRLVDHKTGREIDLRKVDKYTFNKTVPETKNRRRVRKKERAALPQTESSSSDDSRFELIVKTSGAGGDPGDKSNNKETHLGPNYPNPFSNYTQLKLTLQQKAEVKATIYNIVGQKVATVVTGKPMSQGVHTLEWPVSLDLPSGIYICKVQAGNKVLTRKMTLVK